MSARRVRFPEAVEAPELPEPVPRLGPVVFTVTFNGVDEVVDLSDLPCPRLARAMAEALAQSPVSRGSVQNRKRFRRYLLGTVRQFIAFAAAAMPEQGDTLDLDDLEPELLDAYEQMLISRYGQDSKEPYVILMYLVTLLRLVRDALPDGFEPAFAARLGYATAVANRRPVNPLDSYPLPVFEALEAAALSSVGAIRDRILEGERLASSGDDPEVHGWDRLENILWHTERHGPLQSKHSRIPGVVRHGGIRDINTRLFLTSEDMIPFQVLLGCQTGMEPEGVKQLQTDCLANPARGYVSLAYVKRRARGNPHKTLRIRDGGTLRSPGGVIRLALRLTQRARSLEGVSDLWVTVSRRTGEVTARFAGRVVVDTQYRRAWMSAHGIDVRQDKGGLPVTLDLRRLRKTYKSQQYLRAGGILPDFTSGHTSQVAGRHYADIGAHEEIHDQAVEAGLNQALAVALPPPVVLDDNGERLDEGSIEIAPAAVRDALSGATDVWLSSCQDFFASPYATKPGAPCPVPPWVCLECPNAVFTTRHLPSVLSALATIEQQREEFSTADWQARFGQAHQRIINGVLARFSTAQIATARAIAEGDGARLALPPSFLEVLS
ncbi:hypothetical protein ACIO13_05585 [Streptomyces sp. NPDC087425]|uniref:hypothetical protein n=1 Tax=unclassified Streptomyces TaxID=2593676 RepID=UPI003822E91A